MENNKCRECERRLCCGDDVVMFEKCNHIFHEDCLNDHMDNLYSSYYNDVGDYDVLIYYTYQCMAKHNIIARNTITEEYIKSLLKNICNHIFFEDCFADMYNDK